MRLLRVVLAAMLLAFLLTAQSRAQETNSKDKTATFESKTDTTKSETDSETDIGKRLDNAASVFTEIMETPDKGIPTNVLDDAKCIAVGFGGRHGKA